MPQMIRLIPIGNMPTRDPSMRLPFSPNDIKHMVEWLVENAADGTTRAGNKLWQGLMNDPSASAWSSRHTWQSWRQRYLDRQAQYDLMINSELKKREAPTMTPQPFTQQDAKRLAWYFRTEEIPEENRSDISVFKRLIEEGKWEWCARHSDTEWQLLYSVKGKTIDALAASDEPLNYAVPTPIKRESNTPMLPFKRARSSEVILLDGKPIAKRRRVNEASASVPKLRNSLAAPTEGSDPTLVSPLAPFQANGGISIGGPPSSGAEPVAEAQPNKGGNMLEGGIRLANGGTANITVVPESTRLPSPPILVRSASVQLASTKLPKRKWRSKALNSTQTVVDHDYFATPPLPPHSHGAVVDPTLVPLNQIQADAAGQRRARHEAARVKSPDLDFEEVGLEETVVETLEQNVNTTDHLEELTARNGLQTFSSTAGETSTTAVNGISFNISDEYQHPMPQDSAVPDVFSNPPVEGSTRTAIRSSLVTPKRHKGSQPVDEGLTSSNLRFKAAKRNGEGNYLSSSPIVSGRPFTNARAPPRGVPIPVRDPSRIRRSSPPQLRKESQAERRRTFGGWPTNLATSSLHKEGSKFSNARRKRRDSTTAFPTAMVYRDQQEDAEWLRTVEKRTKVISRYADPRKRSIPLLPPGTSSDDTNTADGSGDEDDLAEKVSRMSSLDIERVMNALNVAPRNKVLKQWKQQNRSDAWITWNGLDFVLEELANRFNTRVTAAREVWAAAGDLVVTEKALYHAQEVSQRTVADVIKFEAEQASKRRRESWAPIKQTPERWRRTSGRNTGLYPSGSGPPKFVPAEAVQVAVEAASSPWGDHEIRRGPSKVLRETLDELPMLSFDGVGPGGVSILRE